MKKLQKKIGGGKNTHAHTSLTLPLALQHHLLIRAGAHCRVWGLVCKRVNKLAVRNGKRLEFPVTRNLDRQAQLSLLVLLPEKAEDELLTGTRV